MSKTIELINQETFVLMGCRFLLNLLTTGIIICFLYYRKTQRRDFLFTFFIVNITIFLMVFLLDSVKIQVGFALGLFAIFGILRYRTDTLPVREMTYLFAIIGISVINALSNHKVSVVELITTNLIFIFAFWLLETTRLIRHTASKLIIYERIDLICPSRRPEMLEDLSMRTGLTIERIEIGQIDFLKDVAYVKVYYNNDSKVNTADNIRRTKEFTNDN